MKVIRVRVDDDLLARMDRLVGTGTRARSAFLRAAIETELDRLDRLDLERRHREGYERLPVQPGEFDWDPDEAFWEEL